MPPHGPRPVPALYVAHGNPSLGRPGEPRRGGEQTPPGCGDNHRRGERWPCGSGGRLSGLVQHPQGGLAVTVSWTGVPPPVAPLHAVGPGSALGGDHPAERTRGGGVRAGRLLVSQPHGRWRSGGGRPSDRVAPNLPGPHPGPRRRVLPGGTLRGLGGAAGARYPPCGVGHPGPTVVLPRQQRLYRRRPVPQPRVLPTVGRPTASVPGAAVRGVQCASALVLTQGRHFPGFPVRRGRWGSQDTGL